MPHHSVFPHGGAAAADTHAMLLYAARLLGATALESEAQGCRFEYRGNSFTLYMCEGPVGEYVVGRMRLPEIRPEQDARQVLLGMYLNATLYKTAHFPIWYAVDPEDDTLCLLFCLNARDLTSESIAHILGGMTAPPCGPAASP